MPNEASVQRSVAITLPDGSVKTFDAPVSGAEIAAAIGPGLAKAALAIKVDGVERGPGIRGGQERPG